MKTRLDAIEKVCKELSSHVAQLTILSPRPWHNCHPDVSKQIFRKKILQKRINQSPVHTRKMMKRINRFPLQILQRPLAPKYQASIRPRLKCQFLSLLYNPNLSYNPLGIANLLYLNLRTWQLSQRFLPFLWLPSIHPDPAVPDFRLLPLVQSPKIYLWFLRLPTHHIPGPRPRNRKSICKALSLNLRCRRHCTRPFDHQSLPPRSFLYHLILSAATRPRLPALAVPSNLRLT